MKNVPALRPLLMAGLLALLVLPGVADAKRVALVIGNSAYTHTTPLRNPVNDATDMAKQLKALGFDVTRAQDQTFNDMRKLLQAFTSTAAGSDIALVFYAGHGMEVDRRNFLMPVDARLKTDRDVEFEAISLDLVLRAVADARNLGLVILDACRNNPLARTLQRTGATRAIGRGLGRIEPHRGTLVAYSARDGSEAADGTGRNSPYTEALLENLKQPGVEIGMLFRRVTEQVLDRTARKQEPVTYGSMPSRNLYLHPTSAAPPRPTPSPLPGVSSEAVELAFWQSIQDSRKAADFEAYLRRFPDGIFSELARNRLATLKAAPSTDSTPAPTAAPNQAPTAGSKQAVTVKGVTFNMVFIPAGEYRRGSPENEPGRFADRESPQHRVRITRGFWIGETEVTQALWQAVMGNNPSHFTDCGSACPVESVSWHDSQEFIKRLNGLVSGGGLRLPTEAEWEYAARAGTTGPYAGDLDAMAWYGNNSGDKRIDAQAVWDEVRDWKKYEQRLLNNNNRPRPVAQKRPNAWGLYDMHGNVWEWVQDWYGGYSSGLVTDPTGLVQGADRVYRGGSWYSYAGYCRSANRDRDTPDYRRRNLGLRLARTH